MGSIIILIIFLLLFFLRMPVCMSMGISSLIYFLFFSDVTIKVIPQMMLHGVENFTLLAVPFFLLAGNIMNAGGMTERIFRFASSIIGSFKGGLAQVVVLASIIFGGISGSALADCAGLGVVQVKAMTNAGYSRKFSAAITVAASTIAPIIPPSIIMVIYSVAADTSIARMFIGGIIPGLIMGLTLMVMNYWYAATGKKICPTEPYKGIVHIFKVFKGSFLAILSPLIIILGMVGGMVTPTEASVLAVFYCLIVGLIYKELKLVDIPRTLIETMKQTVVIMYIIGMASVISWIITKERVPAIAAEFILSITKNKYIIYLMINIFLFIVGMLIETIPAMLLVIPVLLPIIDAVGIDRVHFGIVLCVNMIIGIITPPMGIGLYVMTSVAKLSLEEITRETVPFIIPLTIALLIITYIPQTVLFLPNILMGK
ncbi:MAG: TRAP transporter large permease [Thermoplasmata archaeon]